MDRPEPVPVLSQHTIIYDEALFKMLDAIILKYDLKPFCRLGFLNSKPSFHDIWKDINNNINDLNHTRKVIASKDTKPNNFAVLMGLISNYRNLSSWEDVMNENYEVDLREEQGLIKHHCACNHYILNVFVMTNPITHMKVVVGSICINKYMATNEPVIAKIAILEKQIRTKKRKADKAKKIAKLVEEQKVNDLYVGMIKAIKAGAKDGFLRHPINEYKTQLEDLLGGK